MKKRRFLILPVLLLTLLFSGCSKEKSLSGDQLAKNGKNHYLNGDYIESLQSFNEASKKGLKHFKESELYYYMGSDYMQLGDYEKCISYQEKCVELDPENFNALVNLGICCRKTGDRDKAMEYYLKALENDPENNSSAGLYMSLGSLYLEYDKPMSAVKYLEKARDIYDGKNAAVYAYLSIAYKKALEPEKSDAAFDKAKKLGYEHLDKVKEQLDKIK